MPLFMSDDELARLSSDAASAVAEKADEYIRKLYGELDSVRAKADAASITAEQKYLSLSQDFSSLESQNAKLQSDFDDRLAELAQSEERLRELETKITSLQEELTSCKDATATSEEQYNVELFTAKKLVELEDLKLEDSVSEQTNMDKSITELKADLGRLELENIDFQRRIAYLQYQAIFSLRLGWDSRWSRRRY